MIDPISSVNTTQIITEMVFTTLQKVPYLWGILRAAGLVFIAYILFLFIKGFLTFKTNKRVKLIEKKLELVLEKLDLLLDSSNRKNLSKNNKEKKRKIRKQN